MSPEVSHGAASPCQSVTTPPASRTMQRAGGDVPRCRGSARSSRRTRRAAVQARSRLAAPARRRSSKVEQRPLEHREVLGQARPAWHGTGTRWRRSPAPGDAVADTRIGAPLRNAPPPGGRRTCGRAWAPGPRRRPVRPSATSADRHADDGEAVHEVGGAVERVDEPADPASRSPPVSSPKNARSGAAAGEHVAHRLLARGVGVAHPVAGRLLAHVARAAERVEHDLRRRACATRRARRRAARRDRGRQPRHARPPGRAVEQLGRAGRDQLAAHRRVGERELVGRWASTTSAPASRQTSSPPR